LNRLLIIIASALWLTACGPSTDRADLVIINGAEPDSIDPAKIRGQPEGRLAYALFEGLARFNHLGEAEPGVAERWEISPDGKTYTFHLRANAKWSNGDPVTAHDFEWSWLRVLREPEAEYKYQLYYIEGAEAYAEAATKPAPETVKIHADGDGKLVVTLKSPTPFFIDLCAFSTLLPVHRKTVEEAEKAGESWFRPGRLVNNGAFLMQEWRLNHRIRMIRNPLFWDVANVKMQSLDALPMGNPNTALNFYKTGHADLILDKTMVPTSLIDELKKNPDYHASPILATYFIRYNVTRKPFSDPLVRRAFSLVVDKSLLTEKVTKAGEVVADAFTPPGTAGYQPPKGIQRDVTEAKALLAKAGYPNGAGFPVVRYLYTNRSEVDEKIAVELQAMFKRELGISIVLEKKEWAVYLNSLSALDYDFCRSSWVGDYKDPNTFLDMFVTGGGNNNTGWGNPRYDELIKLAGSEVDRTRRFDYFREAEILLIHDELPICPLFNYVVIMLYHGERLGGVQGNLTDEHPFRAMYWKDR
jgi:oligopeptide transport system substrate-binding protein